MDLGLKNKIAVVTGASRGLGYATALQLAREEAKLILNSRSDENLKKAAQEITKETGAEVKTFSGDISLPEKSKAYM